MPYTVYILYMALHSLVRFNIIIIYWLQFMRMALSHQPCERLLGNPRRQLIHEGPVTLIRKSVIDPD